MSAQLEASRNDAAAVRKELEDRIDKVGALKDEGCISALYRLHLGIADGMSIAERRSF